MKYLLLISLLLSNLVYASDLQYRSKIIANNINAVRTVSKIYDISFENTHNGSSTSIWGYRDSLGYGHVMVCKITIDEDPNVSDDVLAWIIGHEMSHCELNHAKYIRALINPIDTWKEEYDADILSKKLMTMAGYNFNTAFPELLKLYANESASSTHPDGISRLANLTTPNQIRVYPQIIKLK
jgi:hypothetical protein